MAAAFPELDDPEYVLLTTFTRDGRAKPTPVWAAPDGDRLLVLSAADAWKIKRIRHTNRVTLTACNVRGRPRGRTVQAVARVLDRSETPGVYAAIKSRYGLLGRAFAVFSVVRGGMARNVGIALTPASPDA